jgi:Domain of unknown function (DUF4157)
MIRETLLALAMAAVPAVAAAAELPAELAARVPAIAAAAADWAERYAAESLASGRALTASEQELARSVGVREPSRVRVRVVDVLPSPDHPMLVAAAGSVGLMPQAASGMTLGHAVILRHGAEGDRRLLSHELRHVAQYEARGGIRPFLAEHIPGLLQFGYEGSPFEVDARAHEVR